MVNFRILFCLLPVVVCLFPIVRSFFRKKLSPAFEKQANLVFGVVLILYSGFIVSEYCLLSYEALAAGIFKSKTVKAWDLEANYLAATHPEGPYARDGVLETRPALSTPPVFALLHVMIRIFGDDFSFFEKTYRVLWWLCNLLIAGILVQYCIRHRKAVTTWAPDAFPILASIFLVGFFSASYRDYLAGNTAFVVATLITIQIALNDWNSNYSKFLQGFLIAVAFYIKPNILLVLMLISVFSIRRRDYGYVTGIVSGIFTVFLLSLLAPNIGVEAYQDFLVETSKSIQIAMQSNWTNLSIERISFYQSHGRLISRSILLFVALLIVLVAGKDDRLTWQEIPCLIVSVIPWPIFWSIYLAWVNIGLWIWIFLKLRARENVYIEIILIYLLTWYGVINPKPLEANFILFALLLLFFKPQIIGWLKKRHASGCS